MKHFSLLSRERGWRTTSAFYTDYNIGFGRMSSFRSISLLFFEWSKNMGLG
jgi:hypothetical protein